MINLAYPSLNGVEPSWADIAVTFSIGGGLVVPMSDIAAIKWSQKLEVGKKRGASGGRIMARTVGQADYDCSATLYRGGLDTLLIGLAAAATVQGLIRGNQALIGQVAFDILVQHQPQGTIQLYTTKIKGCRYMGASDDMKEGADPDKVEITLDPIEIVRIVNGQELALL